jgi:hypothetical protein
MADLIATGYQPSPGGRGRFRAFLMVEKVAELEEPLRDGTRAPA